MTHPALLILMAMEAEAQPVVARLRLRAEPNAFDPRLPFRAFTGNRHGRPVWLAWSGKDARHGVDNIGTQPAVLQSFLAIEHVRPALVLNAGTAGGFQAQGVGIGEVIAGAKEYLYHDRIIPLPGFDRYGLGHFPGADARALAEHLGLRVGVIASGNALETSDRDRDLFARHAVMAKEMEAASLAWVCSLLDVPFYALKAITDWVDHPAGSADQFSANLAQAVEQLALTVERAVDFLVSA
jgi:nucleoside phosphorylase